MPAAGCKEFLGLHRVSRKEEPPLEGPRDLRGDENLRELTDLQSPGLVSGCECSVDGHPCCRAGAADPQMWSQTLQSLSIQACAGAQKGWSVLLQVGDLTDPRSEEQ